MCIYMYVFMYVRMHVCMYLSVCVCVCVYMCYKWLTGSLVLALKHIDFQLLMGAD